MLPKQEGPILDKKSLLLIVGRTLRRNGKRRALIQKFLDMYPDNTRMTFAVWTEAFRAYIRENEND